LATLISAFVNTNGGTIIVGIEEGGRILGIDNAASARSRIEQAIKAVSPSVHVETETVIVDGKSVLVVTVPKGREPPYLTGGEFFSELATEQFQLHHRFSLPILENARLPRMN
jgi:predicted HTH transcriptional regulator